MSFETGYAANEFELQQKLNAFIMSIDGWTKVSQIGPYDAVYFSSGENGLKDIYIRSVAGITEDPPMYGSDQRDFGDGYSGYLNFFVYQYFPENGDGYDGYGQAGQYGPCLYWFVGYDQYKLYYNRVASDNSWESVNHIADQNPPGESQDLVEFYGNALAECDAEFDGKRYWYYWTNTSGLYRFDMAKEAVDTLIKRVEDGVEFCGLQYWVDPQTRMEYVWYIKDNRKGSVELDDGTLDPIGIQNQLMRWDVSAGVSQFGFSGPEWPDNGDRDFNFGALISDGRDNLYCFRGSDEPNWAKYHIPTDVWLNLVDMPCDHSDNDTMVFLDKKTSNFDYHRIYWASESNNINYYINIEGETGIPVGSWTSAGSTPGSSADRSCSIFHNGKNRFFYYNGKDATNGRKLFYAEMTDGTLSWTQNKENTYLPTDGGATNSTFAYVDGYLSRVRTSLYDRTQYWFMGNKDRITVLTKSDGEYRYCYMGACSQYAASTPHALTTVDIYAGSSVEVPLTVLSGEFEVGQRMFISDITDRGGGMYKGELENISRLYKSTEMFEIASVDPGVSITISSLNNNYPAGSRIAYDPQPVGITLDGLDKIQMLNSINTVNTSGSIDMAENIAKLQTVKDDIVNASGGDARRNVYSLWPINIVNTGTDAVSSGTEVRGGLIGVFAVSSTGDLSSEDTISIGSNTYIVFEVPSAASFLYAFGPINE